MTVDVLLRILKADAILRDGADRSFALIEMDEVTHLLLDGVTIVSAASLRQALLCLGLAAYVFNIKATSVPLKNIMWFFSVCILKVHAESRPSPEVLQEVEKLA